MTDFVMRKQEMKQDFGKNAVFRAIMAISNGLEVCRSAKQAKNKH